MPIYEGATTSPTLAQFQWFFRDTAMWAVTHHSPAGGIDAVRGLLSDLGVLDMPIGPGVKFRNEYDLRDLPPGSLVSQGNPSEPNGYTVWQINKAHLLTQVLGARAVDWQRRYLLDAAPGWERPAWLDIEPRPDEVDLIVAWKHQAWEVGWAAKVRWNWCGDFERVMQGMGIRG